MLRETWIARIYRTAWIFWLVGTVLIVLSWLNIVNYIIGGIGAALFWLGILISFLMPRMLHSMPKPAPLKHPLAKFLPTDNEIPEEMRLIAQRVVTNRNAANRAPKPNERLKILDAWGRVDGVNQHYLSKFGCKPEQNIADIFINIVQYKNSDGASQAFNEETIGNSSIIFSPVEPLIDNLGDEAKFLSFVTANDCTPPKIISGLTIRFRYNNLSVRTRVSVVQAKCTEVNLDSVALGIAQSIYNKIVNQ